MSAVEPRDDLKTRPHKPPSLWEFVPDNKLLGRPMDYVEVVLKDNVRIVCETSSLRDQLVSFGAEGATTTLVLSTPSKELLASTMQKLQSLGFYFADQPTGWPPAAVFQQLRDEGMVSGVVNNVSWAGPGKQIFGQA